MQSAIQGRKAMLIKFSHGLGDAVQFTVVLKHLAEAYSDWDVDVLSKRGKHSAFRGLCRHSYHDQESRPSDGAYQVVHELYWFENYNGYRDRPNSKITNCLNDVFGIPYNTLLGRYEVRPDQDAIEATAAYLRSINCVQGVDGKFNAVIIHYQGNTSQHKKNLSRDAVLLLCAHVMERGFVPVILDWDNRSNLPDQRTIFCPRVAIGDPWGGFGSGDAGRIAAMISQSTAFVGIDSGPGKCASATDTPTFIAWHGHHPVQFHDPAPNTIHIVPANHRSIAPAGDPSVAEYFEKHYMFSTYQPGDMMNVVWAHLNERLGGVSLRRDGMAMLYGFWIPEDSPEQSLVIIKDIYLDDAYKTALRPKRDDVEYVIDVGANIGAFTRLWHERNSQAKIASIEVHPLLIKSLKENCPYADVFPVACHYSSDELFMLDSIVPNGLSTGGSRVVERAILDREESTQYAKRTERLETVTLESVCEKLGWPWIDVLKLDCEGSEFSILEHCDLSKVHTIFVESHGPDEWRRLLERRFAGWDIGHMSRSEDGHFENWHLVNPHFKRGT